MQKLQAEAMQREDGWKFVFSSLAKLVVIIVNVMALLMGLRILTPFSEGNLLLQIYT